MCLYTCNQTAVCSSAPGMNCAFLSSPLRGSSSLSRLSTPTMCWGLICSVRHKTASLIRLQLQTRFLFLVIPNIDTVSVRMVLFSYVTLSNSLSIVFICQKKSSEKCNTPDKECLTGWRCLGTLVQQMQRVSDI